MIYLDHNATTPVFPEVREAMLPYLADRWGNPSSSYQFGSKIKTAVESAREQVGELVGARFSREIVFTSGGTESNNTAIHTGVFGREGKRHIITTQVEHSSILSYCRYLEEYHGCRITYLPVNAEGLLSIADLESAFSEDTALVSVMWANNETGVLFPVREIAEQCRSRGVLFHCDAAQTAGKLPIDVQSIPFNYLSLAGHKIGAAKGVGALYVNRKAPFLPLIHGGHQERLRRGGTENTASIVGLGAAAHMIRRKLPAYDSWIRPLRDALENGILSTIPRTECNGHAVRRLSNTANITFHGIESEALLLLLDQIGICASSGSACLADSPDPSHVIAAMKPGSAARQSVRFSLGFSNTAAEVQHTVSHLQELIGALRK